MIFGRPEIPGLLNDEWFILATVEVRYSRNFTIHVKSLLQIECWRSKFQDGRINTSSITSQQEQNNKVFGLAGPQSLGDNTLRLSESGKPLSSKKCSCFPWTKEQKIILVLVKKCAAFFDQSQTANSAEIYASWMYLVICCVVLVLRYAVLTCVRLRQFTNLALCHLT